MLTVITDQSKNNKLYQRRRGFIACAFFVLSFVGLSACSDSIKEQDDTTAHEVSSSTVSTQSSIDDSPALLSLSELLAADDVKNALAQAAKSKDDDLIAYWQETLLIAADEVNLAANERNLLSGEQGKAFLEFQGMRTNYLRDFDDAFFNFGDVDKVYENYPAFQNLHQQSKDLVQKRDVLISKVAKELSSSGFEGDAMAGAKLQWQQSMGIVPFSQ